MLRIRLFGGLALAWGDTSLPLIAGTAARALLAYLVTHRDRPHTRDLLAGTFWPDLPDAVARRRLSQALWQIRRALSPHTVLLAEGDTVQLNPGLPLSIDVEEFTRHHAGCDSEKPDALERCALCLDLYQGEFLAGYYDDWVLLERERLKEMFLAALGQLVEGYKGRGDYERALVHARRMTVEDPLREAAHREVMRLCHLLGRSNEALHQYQVCCQVLAGELSAEPSAGTVALAHEIAASVGAGDVPYLPVAPRASPLALLERPDRMPLVGRQAERAELARYLELAVAGQGGLVLLVGEAGVGKSRLMREMARDAEWRGVRVAWGHSCELSAPLPYQPLIEVLRDADLTQLSPVWKRELSRLLPELDLPPPSLEPEQERGRPLVALARALLALGQAVPHLIILEDVHWMDPASFEALRVLLPRLPASRLLVVGTLRPEEVAAQPAVNRLLAALEDTRIPQHLELAPLTLTETEVLIQRALDLSASVPRFSQRLYAGTEGNPFFVTETLRALVDEGLLHRGKEGGWYTPWDDATEDYAELPVPTTVAQSIERRLARLAPVARELLGLAAVIGREVEFDLWLAAGKGDEGTALAAAEDLAERGLLAEMDDVLGYSFVHDTIRQVVYEDLSPIRRRRWHRQVASALEMLHPDQVEALARHHHLGQNWSQAVRYALQAGERAQVLYANQQALDQYRQADAWLARGRVDWPAGEIARWRADLAEREGRVLSLVGDYKAAEEAFARAQKTWVDQDNWRGVVRILNRLSFVRFIQDDFTGASWYAEVALGALPEIGAPADLQATCLNHLGLSAWSQGRYDDALPPLEQALALFEEIGTDLYGLARCLNSLGMVYQARGELDLAAPCFARSLTLRQQIGDRRGEAWCWLSQGRTALAQGDLAAAREKLETAQAIFAEVEHPSGLEVCARELAEVDRSSTGAGETRRITVQLPRVDAPTGRPLRDDEYVTVAWTVRAPEDEAIAGRVARRQQRLLRLLQEAAEQHAAPTVEDLAEALAVSQPTAKRDLAALRRAGHKVQTRGSRGRADS